MSPFRSTILRGWTGISSNQPLSPKLTRAAGIVALAAIIAFCVVALAQILTPGWWFQDTDAYWSTAIRLRQGQPLYPALLNRDASDVYRYAPWFATAWIPLTYLPQAVAYWLWASVLAAATLLCLRPSLRTRLHYGYWLDRWPLSGFGSRTGRSWS